MAMMSLSEIDRAKLGAKVLPGVKQDASANWEKLRKAFKEFQHSTPKQGRVGYPNAWSRTAEEAHQNDVSIAQGEQKIRSIPEAAATLPDATLPTKALGKLAEIYRGPQIVHREQGLAGAELAAAPAGVLIGMLIAGKLKKSKLAGAAIGGGVGLAAAGGIEAYRRGAFDKTA